MLTIPINVCLDDAITFPVHGKSARRLDNPNVPMPIYFLEGLRTAFFLSLNQSKVSCQTCWLKLGDVKVLFPTAGWRRPVPRSSCSIFFKLFICYYICILFPMRFLMAAAISLLLVVRVLRFFTNSSNTVFSFIAAAARLSKFPWRAAEIIGLLLPFVFPLKGSSARSVGVELCDAPNWSFPLDWFQT